MSQDETRLAVSFRYNEAHILLRSQPALSSAQFCVGETHALIS
jgi:hypothetical protein